MRCRAGLASNRGRKLKRIASDNRAEGSLTTPPPGRAVGGKPELTADCRVGRLSVTTSRATTWRGFFHEYNIPLLLPPAVFSNASFQPGRGDLALNGHLLLVI